LWQFYGLISGDRFTAGNLASLNSASSLMRVLWARNRFSNVIGSCRLEVDDEVCDLLAA
jgi:hypothetical protein